MTWIPGRDAPTGFEAILAHRPELLRRFRAFYESFWQAGLVDHRLLELCRLRIAAIHGCEQEWVIRDARVGVPALALAALRRGDTSAFTEPEQAALAVAERIPHQQHALLDEEVARIREGLGEDGCVALLNALALFDAICRLKLVLDAPVQPRHLPTPPTDAGALA
jgi:alkylhydroperoxidase family enzyme